MKCPVCKKDVIKFRRILWGRAHCPNCEAKVIIRPFTHVVMASALPLAFWGTLVLMGGGSITALILQVIAALIIAILISLIAIRPFQLLEQGSKAYKIEMGLIILVILLLVAWGTFNST